MKLLATAEMMRGFDRTAIGRYRIPGIVLMENAGRCCTDELVKVTGHPAGKQCVVICGKGNNGGDGFVIARHLHNRGARVDVLLLAPPRALPGDAATNFRILRQLQRSAKGSVRIVRLSRKSSLRPYEDADVVVDAIFGTGFSGVPRGMAHDMIEWINGRAGMIVAVDIPSGIAASSGEASGAAVRAHLTVTMGTAKIGNYIGDGRVCSGNVCAVDIGIPREAMTPPRQSTYLIEENDVSRLLPRRPFNANKYSVGKVLVIAGSRSYTGAPVLAALAALKTGAGAVVLCVPESIHGLLVRKLTDVILLPCPETSAGTLGSGARTEIEKKLPWADVVVLGPGLSRHEETDRLVRDLVSAIPCPLVLDADGLNAVSEATAILKRRKTPAILTPHTGELARLVGGESGVHDRFRVEAVRDSVRSLGSIVVLKGAPTVTAEKGTVIVNSTGNPGMATIGSGDVLSGTIAGLVAQHMNSFAAAYAGVFLHGKAGDLAAKEFGERSMLATDILSHLPNALRVLAS